MKKGAKIIIRILYWLISLGIVAIFLFRESIFDSSTIIYNVFNAELKDDIYVKLLKTLLIFDVGIMVIHIARYIRETQKIFKKRTYQTASMLIGSILKYVAGIAIVLVTLSSWGVDTTTLVTGASVLTLIVSLGCQSIVADLVAGMFILFEGDFQVGDVVVIGGWRGTVQSIGLRTTKIIDAAGNVKIVNNSSITEIINNTKDLSLAVCDVGIEYNESLERVETILKENLEILKEKIPAIVVGPFYKGVALLGESSVVIKIIAQCKEEDKYQTERDLNREIKLLFDKHHINIPFNQIVVNYREEDEQSSRRVSRKTARVAEEFVHEQREVSKGIEEEK